MQPAPGPLVARTQLGPLAARYMPATGPRAGPGLYFKNTGRPGPARIFEKARWARAGPGQPAQIPRTANRNGLTV